MSISLSFTILHYSSSPSLLYLPSLILHSSPPCTSYSPLHSNGTFPLPLFNLTPPPLCMLLLINSSFPTNLPSRILHSSPHVHPTHLFIPILSSLSHYSLLSPCTSSFFCLLHPIFLSYTSLSHSSLLPPCTSSLPQHPHLPSPIIHSFTCTSSSSCSSHPISHSSLIIPLCIHLLITPSFPANLPSRILHTSSSVHPHHLFIPILSSLSHYSLSPLYAILLLSSSLHLPYPILLHSSPPVHPPHQLFILLLVSLLMLCFTSSCKARISAPMSNQAEVW